MRLYPRNKSINTFGMCDTCKHYRAVKKRDKTGMVTEFARGRCIISDRYKTRLEACKLWEVNKYEN